MGAPNGPSGGSLAVLGLALLFHDPPWKPWGIRGERVSGAGGGRSGTVYERILSALGERVGRQSRVYERALEAARRVAGRRVEEEYRSHEVQGALLLGALAGALEERGCYRLARIAFKALDVLASDSREAGIVRQADTLASAMDRLLLHAIHVYFKNKGKAGIGDLGVKVVNPFNPRLQVNVAHTIQPELIARFIDNYVRKVSEVACQACRKAPDGEHGMCLLHVAFSLLEPIWYRTVGSDYIPPADTRIPTHTVFDHVNAALATLLWVYQGSLEPAGCIAVVDLAGVQSWIQESRRLRDLWASSWLASYLAWASIEGFVRKYGPGVLVQPPSRLHPFYTSSLILSGVEEDELRRELASLLGLPAGWPIDPTVPSRVVVALPPEACREARAIIIKSYIEAWRKIIGKAVDRASSICRELAGGSGGRGGLLEHCALADEEVARLARELEPPLAVRVIVASVDEAYKRAESELAPVLPGSVASVVKRRAQLLEREGRREEAGRALQAGEIAKSVLESMDRKEVARALFYPALLSFLREAEGRIRISALGRRTGDRHLRLARRLYNLTGGRPKLCLSCGRAYAIIDPGEAVRRLEETGRVHTTLSRLLREIGGERLCPYCLTKRLLRYLLLEAGADRELTGLEAREEARSKLNWDSVIVYTSRTQAIRRAEEKALEEGSTGPIGEVARLLLEEMINAAAQRDVESVLVKLHLAIAKVLAPNAILDDGTRERVADRLYRGLSEKGIRVDRDTLRSIVKLAEEIAAEMAHDKAFEESLAEALAGTPLFNGGKEEARRFARRIYHAVREFEKHRRRFPLVALDADNLGKGVLLGRLGWDPWTYMESAANTDNYEANKALAAINAAITGAIVDKLGWPSEEPLGGPSLAVTPSYHFSVSRALAATSQLDRGIVERLGGMVIYSGGDDLLAILPAVEFSGQQRITQLPPLRAASEARRKYWGTDNGFIKLECGQHTGGHAPICFVVPALAAYGRSGVILYSDVKRPLWAALTELRNLEESKDSASLDLSACGEGESGKDVLFVASDVAGAAAIPLSFKGRLGNVAQAVEKLVLSIEENEVSASLMSDSQSFINLLSHAAKRSPEAAARVLVELFSRNISGEKSRQKATRLLEELSSLLPGSLGRPECLAAARVVVGSRAGEYIALTGFSSRLPGDLAGQLLVYSLIGSARVVRTSL